MFWLIVGTGALVSKRREDNPTMGTPPKGNSLFEQQMRRVGAKVVGVICYTDSLPNEIFVSLFKELPEEKQNHIFDLLKKVTGGEVGDLRKED